MRPSIDRRVRGDDFSDRESELPILETGAARELDRQTEGRGGVFLLADVQDATCPEDVIDTLAEAIQPIRPISSRFFSRIWRWFRENIEEFSVPCLRIKPRTVLKPGTWRREGERLIHKCAEHGRPILLVIDGMRIFLDRLDRADQGDRRTEEFLCWLRKVGQGLQGGSLTIILSDRRGLSSLDRRYAEGNRKAG